MKRLPKWRVMASAAARIFIASILVQLFTTMQSPTNAADVASIPWWKAALVSAAMAVVGAAARWLIPQPVDRPNVAVEGLLPLDDVDPKHAAGSGRVKRRTVADLPVEIEPEPPVEPSRERWRYPHGDR